MRNITRTANLHTSHANCQIELHRRRRHVSAPRLYGEPADVANCTTQNRVHIRLDLSIVARDWQCENANPKTVFI